MMTMRASTRLPMRATCTPVGDTEEVELTVKPESCCKTRSWGREAPFAAGGKPPDCWDCGPLGKRALDTLGENVGEARAPVHADGRLGLQNGRERCQRTFAKSAREDNGYRPRRFRHALPGGSWLSCRGSHRTESRRENERQKTSWEWAQAKRRKLCSGERETIHRECGR